MRKNFGAEPCIYPMPVLIVATYDENKKADAMNAAWGGIIGNSKISMCLGPNHKTVKNILEAKAFTVSMADVDHVVECDYVGIVSANDEPNKMEKAGFHTTKSEFVDAPIINELPMALECELISYDVDTHIMLGEIKNICAEEKILGENGKIDPSKLRPITYDATNHDYLVLGEKVGNAFTDGEKIK